MYHLRYKNIKQIKSSISEPIHNNINNNKEDENKSAVIRKVNFLSAKVIYNKNIKIHKMSGNAVNLIDKDIDKDKINKLVLDNLNKVPIEKINGINKIYYINLDRSNDRNDKMINILSQINVPYERINAIDGNNLPDIKNINININLNSNSLSKYQLGCLLSHIKSINEFYLSDNNNCLILEDDISFVNLNFVNTDIKTIIHNSPSFDILMLSKTYTQKISSMYIQYNYGIWGTMGYIITRNGAKKILNCVNVNRDYKEFDFKVEPEVADSFLYKYCNTLVYKYSIIIDNSTESTIGSSIYCSHNSNYYQTGVILNDMNILS